jgi:hypothetical protein
VKRVLFVIAAAILFVNTLVTPTVVRADGTGGGTSCGSNGTICKP